MTMNGDNDGDDDDEDSNDEPYIVKKVVSKRFRANQCEFLVKLKGYTDNENKWEFSGQSADATEEKYQKSIKTRVHPYILTSMMSRLVAI